jgi:casein kinase II subunit beta
MDVSSESERSDIGWIEWFCDLDGHEFLIEIDEDYIVDNFNLYGLRPLIKHYDQALEMILSKEAPGSEDFNNAEYLTVYESAMDLYGLIHARYITSPKGLAITREKYLMGTFGNCPRVKCKRHYVLPIGTSNKLNESRVKVF